MTEKKRFINDVDNGKLYDTKGEMYTIYYNDKVDFYSLWEFLNKLNDENEGLKQEIRVIEKAKDSFYDKVEGLLTEHIEYNQLKPENMDSIIKELNELKMEIFE